MLAMTTAQQTGLFFAAGGFLFVLLGAAAIAGGIALHRRTGQLPGRHKGLWRLFVVGGGFVFIGGIFAVLGLSILPL